MTRFALRDRRPVALYLPSPEHAQRPTTLALATRFLAHQHVVDLLTEDPALSAVADVPPGSSIVDVSHQHLPTALPHLCRYVRLRRPALIVPVTDRVAALALLARGLTRTDTRIWVAVPTPSGHPPETLLSHRVARAVVRHLQQPDESAIAASSWPDIVASPASNPLAEVLAHVAPQTSHDWPDARHVVDVTRTRTPEQA